VFRYLIMHVFNNTAFASTKNSVLQKDASNIILKCSRDSVFKLPSRPRF
jgi:hypothetical protein